MQQQNSHLRETIHQATYKLLRQVASQMQPVAQLAQEVGNPNEPHPMDTVVQLLQQLVSGVDRIHDRLEHLEARLDEPAVIRAIKAAARG